MSKLNAISLFSGMGGDSLAITNSGLNLVGYSEKENTFRNTHDLNFPNSELIGNGDILETNDNEFLKYKGKVDLIFAGFPCQGFSNAGKKKTDDPRNTLFREFHRATKLINPKYIIGENVKGLMNKYTITLESIADFFNKYNITKMLKNIKHNKIETLYPHLYTLLLSNGVNYLETNINELLSEYTLLLKNIKDKEADKKNIIVKKLYNSLKKINDETKDLEKSKITTIKIISIYNKLKDTSQVPLFISNIYNSLEQCDLELQQHKYMEAIYDKIKVSYIDIIRQSFEDIGYIISHKVLKTEEYNIPQKRQRLIIVGKRKIINKKDNKNRFITKQYEFPNPIININLNLIGIINFDMTGAIKINKDDFDMTNIPKECMLTDMTNTELGCHCPNKCECDYKPHPNLKLLSKDKYYEYNNIKYPRRLSFGKRESSIHGEIIDIRTPAKTIICTYARQPRLFVPLQNKNGYYLRCLLPVELKQIQGFPLNYKLSGSVGDQIVQIGNAVPPPLIEQIISNLI